MALESAFEPSMMNRRGTAGSSPRSIKLSISAWTTAECSVAPSMSPSGCFVPSLSIPIAATSTISSAIWMPSICTTMMSRWPRSDAIHSFMRAADNATKRREVADFDTPAPRGAGTSPSGSRTARRNFRVDTLINIRFIAHRPSQSSSLARSQLGSGNSWPSKSRTRGRLELHFAAVEADLASGWAPAVPASPLAARVARPADLLRILLQHGADRLQAGGQAETFKARRHFLESLTHRPARHGARSRAKSLHGVAFLSWNHHPSLPAQGEQRRSFYFNIRRDILTDGPDDPRSPSGTRKRKRSGRSGRSDGALSRSSIPS